METGMAHTTNAKGGDMPFMTRAYIDEYDVVQRYIRRTLTESELTQFEIYMLSNADIVDEIEQQRMLNEIFREELPKATRALASSSKMLHRFRRTVPLAACLMLAVYVGMNIGDRAPADAQSVTLLNTVVLQDLRGASSEFNVALPADMRGETVGVPLKIDVGPQLESAMTYNVVVRSADSGTVIAQQDNHTADADGWLLFTVELPGIAASYQVEVVELPQGGSRSYTLSLQ